MKMNYRERVGTLIFIVVVVILAGWFGLINPLARKKIPDQKIELAALQAKKAELEQKIAEIPVLETKIKEGYNRAYALTTEFVPFEPGVTPAPGETEDDPGAAHPLEYQVDKAFQDLFDNYNVRIESFATAPLTTAQLDYYVVTPPVVLKADIIEAADINGDIVPRYQKVYEESETLKIRKKETVITQTVTVTANFTKQDLRDFLNSIKDNEKAIRVKAISISDITFNVPYWQRKSSETWNWIGDTEEEHKPYTVQQWLEMDRGEGYRPTFFSKATDIILPEGATDRTTGTLMGYSDVTFTLEMVSVVTMPEPDTTMK